MSKGAAAIRRRDALKHAAVQPPASLPGGSRPGMRRRKVRTAGVA